MHPCAAALPPPWLSLSDIICTPLPVDQVALNNLKCCYLEEQVYNRRASLSLAVFPSPNVLQAAESSTVSARKLSLSQAIAN